MDISQFFSLYNPDFLPAVYHVFTQVSAVKIVLILVLCVQALGGDSYIKPFVGFMGVIAVLTLLWGTFPFMFPVFIGLLVLGFVVIVVWLNRWYAKVHASLCIDFAEVDDSFAEDVVDGEDG